MAVPEWLKKLADDAERERRQSNGRASTLGMLLTLAEIYPDVLGDVLNAAIAARPVQAGEIVNAEYDVVPDGAESTDNDPDSDGRPVSHVACEWLRKNPEGGTLSSIANILNKGTGRLVTTSDVQDAVNAGVLTGEFRAIDTTAFIRWYYLAGHRTDAISQMRVQGLEAFRDIDPQAAVEELIGSPGKPTEGVADHPALQWLRENPAGGTVDDITREASSLAGRLLSRIDVSDVLKWAYRSCEIDVCSGETRAAVASPPVTWCHLAGYREEALAAIRHRGMKPGPGVEPQPDPAPGPAPDPSSAPDFAGL